jgi:hypothetical protein
MVIGTLIYWLAAGYVCCGGAVAVAFLSLGLDRIDPSARGAYTVRPLLVPGLMLLWPLVLVIWCRRLTAATEV